MKRARPFNFKDYQNYSASRIATLPAETGLTFFADLLFAVEDPFRREIISFLRRDHPTLITLLEEFPVHENELIEQLQILLRFGLIYLEKRNGKLRYYLLHRNFAPGMLEKLDKHGSRHVLPDPGVQWYQLFTFSVSEAGKMN